MFKFDINITDQDYSKFNAFNSEYSKYGKRTMKGLRIFLVVLFLLGAIGLVFRYGVTFVALVALIPLIILFVLFIVFLKYFLRFFNGMAVKGLTKTGKKLYSPVSVMEFSEEYVVEITPDSEMKYKYSALDAAYFVRGEVVYIYINPQQAFIIPVDSFESQEQWDRFLEFINAKMEEVVVIEQKNIQRNDHIVF